MILPVILAGGAGSRLCTFPLLLPQTVFMSERRAFYAANNYLPPEWFGLKSGGDL